MPTPVLTLASMAALPRPTPAQRSAFVLHLTDAHSWYKHLRLPQGGRFVVFLAPDAGGGFDERRKRLHHTWKTTAEYRERFGHYDYMWRLGPDDDAWSRDGGENAGPDRSLPFPVLSTGAGSGAFAPVDLPEPVWRECSFTLYPYACNDMGGFVEVGDRGEDPAVPDVVRRTIAAARAAELRLLDARHELSEDDRRRLRDIERYGYDDDPVPDAVEQCLALGDYLHDLYGALRAPEVGKIWLALDRLDALVWGNPNDDES